MGGHGGLNILPQKKWNVYGRENRLRVARDEKEHAEKVEQEQAERREREREARYRALSAKGAKNVVVLDDKGAMLGENVDEEKVKKKSVRLEEEPGRGDPLTRTSDAVFDQSFQFARGMQEKPWWCVREDVENREKGMMSCLGHVKVMDPQGGVKKKRRKKKDVYEALRQERLDREAREREKANAVMRGCRP